MGLNLFMAQTINLMDNGQPALPSTVNLSLTGAAHSADVIVCDTMLSVASPTNGFAAMCFNIYNQGGGGSINGIGAVVSSSVPASSYFVVYKRKGLVIGKNLSAAGWIYVDSVKVSKGATSTDTLLYVALTNTIYITNWDTLGLFVGFRSQSPLMLKFNTGTTLGGPWKQKYCQVIHTGYGGASIFNAAFSPRDFGGYINYCCYPSGIHEYSNLSGFEIYPNPSSDFITVKVPSQHFYISITNILGEIVLRDNSLNQSKNIDVRSLPNGIYSVKIFTNDKKSGIKQLVIKR